jgi:hypothetical protein
MKIFQTKPGKADPWVPVFCEMIGTALLVFGGLSLVILTFGASSPVAAIVPSVRLRQVLTGFLFGCVGGNSHNLAIREREWSTHQPGGHIRFLDDGKNEATDCSCLHSCAIGWGGAGMPAATSLGRDGSQYRFRGHFAREGIHSLGSVSGRDHHFILPGGNAFYLYRIPQVAALYSGRDSFPVCNYGSSGGSHLRHQHKSRSNLWSCGYLGRMGRLVDLLDWAFAWSARIHRGLQFPYRENRRSEDLSLRMRPPKVVPGKNRRAHERSRIAVTNCWVLFPEC